MSHVSDLDYERILAIVAEASHGTFNEPVPGHVLEMIRVLAGCDVAAYFDGAPADRATRRVWATPIADPWTLEERTVVDRCRFDLPLYPSPPTYGRAVRISDVLPQSRYRNLEIYRLAGQRHGIEYAMEYWFRDCAGHIRGLTFDDSTHEFTDRTRDAVEVLGRHLRTVVARYDDGPMSKTTSGLTARQAEILALVARGRTNRQIGAALSISPHTVRKHLENAFASIGVHSRAEAVHETYGRAGEIRPLGPRHTSPERMPAA